MTQSAYERIHQKIMDLVALFGIDKVPVLLENIIDQIPNMQLCSYSWYAQRAGCSMDDVIAFFGSDLGAYTRDGKRDRFIIFYNDAIEKEGLSRFTIAHELGHHFLEHAKQVNTAALRREGLDDEAYAQIESEANYFARNLLAPAPLIALMDMPKNAYQIERRFHLTPMAAKVRLKALGADLRQVDYEIIAFYKQQFAQFLADFNTYDARCNRCGAGYGHSHNHCRICGAKRGRKMRGQEKIREYTFVSVDQNSKVEDCPTCGNIQLQLGSFCPVCGGCAVNICMDNNIVRDGGERGCNTLLAGDARYCHRCGEKGTFLQYGVLAPWNSDKQ